jgi:hypothetical protein
MNSTNQEMSTPELYASMITTQSPKRAADWSALEDGDKPKETQHVWYHSIDRKHIFAYVKFEVKLFNLFTRKCLSKNSGTFHRSGLGAGPI